MTVKKSYKAGDSVWIYGITRTNNRLHKGEIIHSFTLEHAGWNNEPHYVIAINNEIEPLLEVRSWHNISQDEHGPVGCFRHEVPADEMEAVDKKLSQLGLTIEEYDRFEEHMAEEDDEVSPEQIHAAMERASKSATLPPLNLKESGKPKRRFNNNRRKKTNAN
jgi:hypothetical protein